MVSFRTLALLSILCFLLLQRWSWSSIFINEIYTTFWVPLGGFSNQFHNQYSYHEVILNSQKPALLTSRFLHITSRSSSVDPVPESVQPGDICGLQGHICEIVTGLITLWSGSPLILLDALVGHTVFFLGGQRKRFVGGGNNVSADWGSGMFRMFRM